MSVYVNIDDSFTQGGGADGTEGNPYDWNWLDSTGRLSTDTYYLTGSRTGLTGLLGFAGGTIFDWWSSLQTPWRLSSTVIGSNNIHYKNGIIYTSGDVSAGSVSTNVFWDVGGSIDLTSGSSMTGSTLVYATGAGSWGQGGSVGLTTSLIKAGASAANNDFGGTYTFTNTATDKSALTEVVAGGIVDGGGNVLSQTITSVPSFSETNLSMFNLLPGYGVGLSWAVATDPIIEAQPSNETVTYGATGTFGVSASNVDYYNWYSMIGGVTGTFGVTGPSLYIPNAQESNQGEYRAVVLNGSGSATSDPATLTVVTPPYITTQPASTLANQGQMATFGVALISDPDYSVLYQWSKDGSVIAGATGPNLSVSASSQTVGVYAVHIDNGPNSVDSNTATLGLRTTDPGQGSSQGTVGMPGFGQNGNNMAGGGSGFELPRKGNEAGDQVDNSQSNNPVNELESPVANRNGAGHGSILIPGRDQDRF